MDCHGAFGAYFRRTTDIQKTLRNVARAHSKGVLVKRDLTEVYEGLFLQSVVGFELLVEDVFLRLLAGQLSHARATKPVVVFPNVPAARKIVTRDRYQDWLPYNKLKELSQIYFMDGKNPFDACPSRHSNEIQKACYIRNYIAHKSDYAKRIFDKKVVAPTSLPRGQRNLLGYFRFPHASAVTKFDYHLGELVNAARWLCGL